MAAGFAGPGDLRSVVRVIDLADEHVIVDIDTAVPNSLAFSPDGRALGVGDIGSDVARVFDATSGEELLALTGHDAGVRDVAWSSTSRWIATAGDDGTVRVWDALTGELRSTFSGHRAVVMGISWSPDAALLATVSDDGTARVLTVDDDGLREVGSLSASGTSAGLIGVAFSPDGERLMTGDIAIVEVNVWDVTAIGGGERINAEAVPEKAADFSPDSRGVVIGSEDAVSILDVETALPAITIEPDPPVDAGLLDMSPDGHLIAASSWDPAVHVFDAATGDHAFTIDGGGYGWASDLGWSGDSQLLAVSFELPVRSEVVIVDQSGRTVGTIPAAPGFGFDSVDLSPNGAWAIVTSSRFDTQDTPAKVEIWDWRSGEIVQTVETSANRAAFDPTGERIATNVWHTGGVADVERSDRRSTARQRALRHKRPTWPSVPTARRLPPRTSTARFACGTPVGCPTVGAPRTRGFWPVPWRSARTVRCSCHRERTASSASGHSTSTTSSPSPLTASHVASPTTSAVSSSTSNAVPQLDVHVTPRRCHVPHGCHIGGAGSPRPRRTVVVSHTSLLTQPTRGVVMALITEDVQASATEEAPQTPTPGKSFGTVLGWTVVGVALVVSAALAFGVLRDDDSRAAVPIWRGDTKDHPGFGPVDPATLPWIGDTKDHPGFGPVDPATLPWIGDTKDHPGFGPVDPATLPWIGDTKDHPGFGPVDPATLPWIGDTKDHPLFKRS